MKRVGREAVEVNINSPQDGHIPIFDLQNRLWYTIPSSSLVANSSSFAESASYAATASSADDFFVRGTLTAQTIIVQVITASHELVTGSLIVSGSIVALSGVTGSLFGTASWAYKSITSSFAETGTGVFSGSFSGSFSGNGSQLTDIPASSVVGLNLSRISSGSVTASVDPDYGFKVNSNSQFSGSVQITGSLGITGSLSMATESGSVFFSNADTLVLTGSFYQTGSYNLTGSLFVKGAIFASNITGSLYGTSSWAENAISASYVKASGVEGLDLFRIYTGSVSASVDFGGDKLFLINSGSQKYLNISSSGNTEFYSSLFIVRDFTTEQPIFKVSQSIVNVLTHSIAPTGQTEAGSIWFTPSEMYIGLE